MEEQPPPPSVPTSTGQHVSFQAEPLGPPPPPSLTHTFHPADPTAGPSSINLNSPSRPHNASFNDPNISSSTTTSRPIKLNISSLASRGMRARGRGRGRGGRGAVPGGGRASTRISQRTEASKTHGHSHAHGPGHGHGLKLSLKVGGGEGGNAGRKTSFLGDYDRELDENPDDPIAFEEQFILRVPESVAEGPNGLREMVKGKGKGLEGVEFKFLDSRRAAFKINGVTYASKLVDLPNIIESQKTFDNRHLFKVADISQMLVVENPVKDESYVTQAPLKVDDYVWPHGITPPLRHVRKRRFRKRMSRQTIEVVEEKVEELLKKDAEADKTDTGPASFVELLDIHPDPDVPDEFYINYDPNAVDEYGEGEYGSEYGGSEMYDDPGSVTASQMDYDEGQYAEDGEEDGDGEGGDDEDGAFDEELAAALRDQMEGEGSATGQSDDEGMSEDDDDDEAEKSEDDDDDETAEKKAKIKQFTAEIKALEGAIEKKRAGFTGGNPIIIVRITHTNSQRDIGGLTDSFPSETIRRDDRRAARGYHDQSGGSASVDRRGGRIWSRGACGYHGYTRQCFWRSSWRCQDTG
ncbi:TAFII55 protein conserved region-domain-containing protein [Naematelia encephala]|uniref:TAFII55 protein conserved region-domain-containing protein n=1 Tax=Naematelia encephala TaxID=71784 RepID=A0A1Y2B4H7_9TREE|nr:TAFII55 protein conserved region-domain-containing protein [Naematelia encephala]